MQKNWIGKSYGTEIDFEIESTKKNISNVIIVHGSPNQDGTKEKDYIPDSEKAWIGWTKKELEKKKINFYVILKNFIPSFYFCYFFNGYFYFLVKI